MVQDPFRYDVAFSFLGQDEALARKLVEHLRDRLRVFIYSDAERQTKLSGRDGEEAFARIFGRESRTVVVLYRQGGASMASRRPKPTRPAIAPTSLDLNSRRSSLSTGHPSFLSGSPGTGSGTC